MGSFYKSFEKLYDVTKKCERSKLSFESRRFCFCCCKSICFLVLLKIIHVFANICLNLIEIFLLDEHSLSQHFLVAKGFCADFQNKKQNKMQV